MTRKTSNILQQLKARARRNRTALIMAAVNAVVVFVLSCLAENLPYWFAGSPSVGQRYEMTKAALGLEPDTPDSGAVLINVAFDRQLVDVNENWLPVGNTDIAARSKLLSLLQALDSTRTYRYILIDVFLDSAYTTGADSALAATIARMPRITIANTDGISLIDSSLTAKSATADYPIHILENNFVRYPTVVDGSNTVAYDMYLRTGGEPVRRVGPLAFCNGNLCQASPVLKFRYPYRNATDTVSSGGMKMLDKSIRILGSDVLDGGIDIGRMADDKLVIIGDFSARDCHDTFLGPINGSVIVLNAYHALRNGDIILPWWLVFVMLAVFVMTSLAINKHVVRLFRSKNRIVALTISLLSLTSCYIAVAICIYLTAGISLDITVPVTYFTLYSVILNKLTGPHE